MFRDKRLSPQQKRGLWPHRYLCIMHISTCFTTIRSYTQTIRLNKHCQPLQFVRRIAQVSISLYILDIKPFALNLLHRTVDTEFKFLHLGVTLSDSIQHNNRNVSIAIHCAFSKTIKSGNISANVTIYTAVKPTALTITQHRAHSHTMIKMLCKSYGRSSTLRLIKPCYTVKAVCHLGPCESEQSLVTPSGIYQRLLVGGTLSLEENSF